MKKNENDSAKSPDSMLRRLFNGIKNSPKKQSKKAFGKIGLFLIFGMMILNLNLGFKIEYGVIKHDLYINNISASEYDDLTFREAFFKGFAASWKDSDTKKLFNFVIDKATAPFVWVFNFLLYSVLWVLAKILLIAGDILDFGLGVEYLRDMIRTGEIYKLWAVVRDTVNMVFMIFLLFSAFATIFQVEKYHLKKIMVMLVVMALLVNFSYAIAIFVIDFSNSLMDFLLNIAFGDDNLSKSAEISAYLNFGDTLLEINDAKSFTAMDTTGTLILSIILLFMYCITIVAYAGNLLIRMVAFIILVILSPIGFAFAFFPSTQKLSNSWWDSLFKYAFMGPMMAFFLVIVSVLFRGGTLAANETIDSSGIIPLHVIGIVFLWMGLKFSGEMGGAASGVAMDFAKKTGNNIKSYSQKAAWGTAGLAGKGADSLLGNVPSGAWNATKNRFKQASDNYKDRTETRAAKIGGFIGVKDAEKNLERKRYEEDAKKMKTFTIDDLETKAKSGNIAAADELLSRKALNQSVYEEAIKNSKDKKRSEDLTAKYKGANKETRIDIVASINARKDANDSEKIAKLVGAGYTADQASQKLLEDEIRSRITNLNHADFAKQNFEKIYEQIRTNEASTEPMIKLEGDITRRVIREAFVGLNANAQNDVRKNLSSNQLGVLQTEGVV